MTEKPSNLNISDYMVGQTVRVMVTRIEPYGALIETQDGHRTPGLIHKSNIAYAYVTDPGHYFAFTDELDAEIVKVEPDGRLSLSTKGFGLKPKYQFKPAVVPNPIVLDEPVKTMDKPVAEKQVAEKPIALPEAVSPIPDEMKEVFQYLASIVGAVTPAAQTQFVSLVEKFGMFRFTKALTKTEEGFQKDLGLAFAKQLESSLSQSL
jgi:predicted RNA-binding protein with RPS1 domain